MPKTVYEGLSPAQREAVTYDEGPLLVLAGAGSGKTKVITCRFAHLAGKNPNSVAAFTFTNKASDEMKERIARLLKKDMRRAWVGTFHCLSSRVLRKEIHLMGMNGDFSILDEDDQADLIKHILKEFKIYEAFYKGISARISLLKSSLIGPEKFLSGNDVYDFEDKLSRVYVRYEQELRKYNALDFDDLILMSIRLFGEHPKALGRYRSAFRHILVDEFQDTNYAQYRLLSLLAPGPGASITAVGDDDQGIYAFRGSDRNNILNFQNDYPGAKAVTLEQNYRCTRSILDAACKVITANTARHPKKLSTNRTQGEKVFVCKFGSEDEESKYIAKAVRELYLKGAYKFRDFAVLYRANFQSRPLEVALRDEKIPYRIVGGMSLYHRKEIKDLLAYFRLAVNHSNSVCLRRIINRPPRGIGASTMSRVEQVAKKKSLSLFSAIKDLIKTDNLTAAMKEKLGEFVRLIEGASAEKLTTASEILRHIYRKTGYADFIDGDRAKDIQALIVASEGLTVKDFADRISLLTGLDDANRENAVTLTTLHAAKGLEFPAVFISGVEEGVIPYYKAKEQAEIEEERRLLYVGMTRAKDLLWLTSAKKRRFYTKLQEQQPSRFLRDIPAECCQMLEKIAARTVERPPEPKAFKPIFYRAGSRVKHPVWGVGVIRDSYGDGEEQKITVNFPNIGVKRLAIKYAQLERI